MDKIEYNNGYQTRCMETRKFLLLLVLALAVCCISGSAQTMKGKVKSDSTSHCLNVKGNVDRCISKDDQQHRDSVRVLEWIQCTVCWGSGDCPYCKKYGRKYKGNDLKDCPSCGGSGRCRQCFGKGGDHYYVWEYTDGSRGGKE